MAKVKISRTDQLLLTLQRNLDYLLNDQQIPGDPFELDNYENLSSSSKSAADNFLNRLVEYYQITENWNINIGDDIDIVGIAGSIYRTSKKSPMPLSHPLLKAIGGYLRSDWFVFVPFLNTVDIFKNMKDGAYLRSYDLGGEKWVVPIQDSRKIAKWIIDHLPQAPVAKTKTPLERADLFHHQMCQIGGGKYDGKLVKGHYFVFRCKGSLRGLDAGLDPSKYFALFVHGLTAENNKGKSIFDAPFLGHSDLSPDGVIGVNLKDLDASRSNRHTSTKLKVRLKLKLLQEIKTSYFSDIVSALFKSDIDEQWKKLKVCADLLYQFIENEGQINNGYTKNIVSTVLLCSAGETLLGIAEGQPKKRKFSNLLGLLYVGWEEDEFEKCRKFLADCYKVRSDFVHDGLINDADNARLFSIIFICWQNLAANQVNVGAKKYSPITYIKEKAPKKSSLYKSMLMSELFSG